MIVRPASGRLQLITQPDHAAAARAIMEHWPPLQSATRRDSILLAVREHDNGWRELDEAPSVDPDRGTVFDFLTLPLEQRQGVWPRGVDRLAGHDQWAAALVAHHAVFVYHRYRGQPAWSPFFHALETRRDALVSACGNSTSDLISDYAFLRIGDLISLTFCTRMTDEQAFDGWTFRLDGDRVLVTPDVLNGRDISFAVVAREVADVPYRSDSELRAAVRAGRTVTLNAVLCASPS
ncbi:MAG TPA: DUF3891 family protein [Vicinamibacterales bacterium]|jgi:hypothetical protein